MWAGSPARSGLMHSGRIWQVNLGAGWQPAAASSGETVRFVCGLAARSALKWRNNSFSLRAGSPQQPRVPKQFVSSEGSMQSGKPALGEGWQPAAASSGGFVCGLAARSGLMCRNSSFRLPARCNQAGQYWVRAGSPQRPQVA